MSVIKQTRQDKVYFMTQSRKKLLFLWEKGAYAFFAEEKSPAVLLLSRAKTLLDEWIVD